MGNVMLSLYRVRGLLGTPELVAEAKSDDDGRFEFKDLEWPHSESRLDGLAYGVVVQAAGRAPLVHPIFEHSPVRGDGTRLERLEVGGAPMTIAGQVVNELGQPIVGAWVWRAGIQKSPVPGVQMPRPTRKGTFPSAICLRRGCLRKTDTRSWFDTPTIRRCP